MLISLRFNTNYENSPVDSMTCANSNNHLTTCCIRKFDESMSERTCVARGAIIMFLLKLMNINMGSRIVHCSR